MHQQRVETLASKLRLIEASGLALKALSRGRILSLPVTARGRSSPHTR